MCSWSSSPLRPMLSLADVWQYGGGQVITLHSIKGEELAINGGLIERVQASNDVETHVLVTTGTTYVVSESVAEIAELHREDRAIVDARAMALRDFLADPVAKLGTGHGATVESDPGQGDRSDATAGDRG